MENEYEQELEQTETHVDEGQAESMDQDSQELSGIERLRQLSESGEEPTIAESVEELPVYEPNLSYKIKNEEKQFADWLGSAVSDKEKEDYLRDLYTRADALDGFKDKYSKAEEEADMYYGQAQQLTDAFKAIQQFRDKGEFRKLQKALGVDDEYIVKMALDLVDEANLPENERNAIQAKRKADDELVQMRRELDQIKSERHNREIQNDINELKSLVQSPEIKPIAEAMMAKNQNFVEQVMALGKFEYDKTGVEPTVAEMVNRVADQNRWILDIGKQQLPVVEKPKTLPTVRGTGTTRTSPPKLRSLEDLKKLANSL